MQLRPIMTANGSFEKLRQGGYLYVDKTAYLLSLVRQDGNMFFLSRPRRFGKTLTVSTLEAIFQGKRELFKGLFIDSADYDWKAYPIIHIDFGSCGKSTPEDLDGWLKDRLEEIAESYGVGPLDRNKSSDDLFAKLILLLCRKAPVVVLIDEYDKVLSDHIFSPEVEKLRQVLGNFYQVIKTNGALLRFAFITGVTRFARLSVFSQMNNLKDLSMSPVYATMLGYTQEELESCFAGYIEKGLKDAGMEAGAYLARIRDRYDGYRFAPGSETVYNPVSVGLFFDPETGGGQRFKDFWVDTGGMRLIMDMAQSVDFDVRDDLAGGMSERALDTFDVAELRHYEGDRSKVQAFLLQTGYLTIGRYDEKRERFYLDFPNIEVRKAFLENLMDRYCGSNSDGARDLLKDALDEGAVAEAMRIIQGLFASNTYHQNRRDEAYFCGFMHLIMADVDPSGVSVEVAGSSGRADMVLRRPRHLYVMEFKVDQDAEVALDQIKEKHYADAYLLERGRRVIHLLGISFSSKSRSIAGWKEEILH